MSSGQSPMIRLKSVREINVEHVYDGWLSGTSDQICWPLIFNLLEKFISMFHRTDRISTYIVTLKAVKFFSYLNQLSQMFVDRLLQ